MNRSLPLLTALFLLACGSQSAGPDAGSDASVPTDAGTHEPDASSPDAGDEPEPDAGDEPEPDAGDEPEPDAGDEPEPDAGEEPDAGPERDPELLWNGGFEQWDDVLPDRWVGERSNISESSVQKVTTDVFAGDHACALVNESNTHKRFTTAPISAPAGRYDCSYQVRGYGEVRNARYDTDYSSYKPSGYHRIAADEWEEKTYSFSLADDVHDTFELIFSVRNTSGEHLVLDNVSCRRQSEPCDDVACEDWAQCVNATATCEPRSGRCGVDEDCAVWELCNAEHRCEPDVGRCNSDKDCTAPDAWAICNGGHHCQGGNPCETIDCVAPRTCDPGTASCRLEEGTCVTTADCTGDLPACDAATNTCVGAEHPANIFPNGGFESWSLYDVPYHGDHWLPDAWYGLERFGATEIDPADVREYTASVHGGTKAVQLIGGEVADRFTSEPFDVPSGNYTCSYQVRGKGTIRHRLWSTAGWNPYTDFVQIDSDEWQRQPFTIPGNVRDLRLILYPSRTDAARDHLQVDDIVCTKNG